MAKFIVISVFIILILVTIRFFIDLLTDSLNGDKFTIAIKAFLSAATSIIVICILGDKSGEIFNLPFNLYEYSFIPLYIYFHLVIWLLICFLIFFVGVVAYYFLLIFKFSFINIVCVFIKGIIKIIVSSNEKFLEKYRKFRDVIDTNINPISALKNYEFSIVRIIKICFVITYLISGLIVLSPMTRYVKAEVGKELLAIENNENRNKEETYIEEIKEVDRLLKGEEFKNDYELYKSFFVTSLIPFSLKYLFKGPKRKDKK